MTIFIFGNYTPSLTRFRLELIETLALTHKVFTISSLYSYSKQDHEVLISAGASPLYIRISRGLFTPLYDLFSLCGLIRLLVIHRPDSILCYTIKPILLTSFSLRALRLFSRHKVSSFPLVTGLGYAFTQTTPSIKRSIAKHLLSWLLRSCFSNSHTVVFQNSDDMSELRRSNILPTNVPTCIVNGSGVNLDLFTPQPLPPSNTFLMIARLLKDKGVYEYLFAAQRLKDLGFNATFLLAGPLDTNPASISLEELQPYIRSEAIQYLGPVSDVLSILRQCRFFVLPSYREGTPRSVLEAMAAMRPIITTDVPGCRETCIDGFNGFLVEAQNQTALAQSMIEAVALPNGEVMRMARNSLTLAQRKYDVRIVNQSLVSLLENQ